ncbi:Pfs NB-ARC and TPR domain protein [Penicillium longicatenatum]|nr:Pfs NB-ARC and TPR domain protein [Penicillium longicatenatum]
MRYKSGTQAQPSYSCYLLALITETFGITAMSLVSLKGSYQSWCHHVARTNRLVNPGQLCELALISIGWTVPSASEQNYSELQQRLIPHANYVRLGEISGNDIAGWGAFHGLGNLYSD